MTKIFVVLTVIVCYTIFVDETYSVLSYDSKTIQRLVSSDAICEDTVDPTIDANWIPLTSISTKLNYIKSIHCRL